MPVEISKGDPTGGLLQKWVDAFSIDDVECPFCQCDDWLVEHIHPTYDTRELRVICKYCGYYRSVLADIALSPFKRGDET